MARCIGTVTGAVLAVLSIVRPTPAQRSTLDSGVQRRDTLHGEAITEPGLLSSPLRVRVAGGTLVVLDNGGDNQVVLVDARTGRVSARTGRRGQGLGEFEHPWSLEVLTASPLTLSVYDPSQTKLTRIAAGAHGELRPQSALRLPASPLLTEPLWLDASRLVSPGLLESSGRVALLDSSGAIRRYIGRVPVDETSPSLRVVQHAYQAFITTNGRKDLIAVATRHADRLDIYDTTGRHVAAGPRPDHFEPEYRVVRRNGKEIFSGADIRFGFVDIVSMQDRIYALYSGKNAQEAGKNASFGQIIYVTTWLGERAWTYQLPSASMSIDVSADGRYLYAVTAGPMPRIVRYVLPVPD